MRRKGVVFSKMFVLRSMGTATPIAKVDFCFLCLISMFFIGFSKSLWYKMSHETGMLLFCKQFTFEMFKIMKLALSVVSVWLNLSWY